MSILSEPVESYPVRRSEGEKAAFILFDNEEKGKKCSKAYFSDHR